MKNEMLSSEEASESELLASVAPVATRQVEVTLGDGTQRTLSLSAFRYIEGLNAMYAEAAALKKKRRAVPLPADDPSGERSFTPSEPEVYGACFLAHIVQSPKMDVTRWLIFQRRNSFEANRVVDECLEVAGLKVTAKVTKDKDGKEEVDLKINGVQEAKEALEKDTFPGAPAGGMPEASVVSPGPSADAISRNDARADV